MEKQLFSGVSAPSAPKRERRRSEVEQRRRRRTAGGPAGGRRPEAKGNMESKNFKKDETRSSKSAAPPPPTMDLVGAIRHCQRAGNIMEYTIQSQLFQKKSCPASQGLRRCQRRLEQKQIRSEHGRRRLASRRPFNGKYGKHKAYSSDFEK